MSKKRKENAESPKHGKVKKQGRKPRRENYVDSFRWGFVDEGGASNDNIPDEDLFFGESSDYDFVDDPFDGAKVVTKAKKDRSAKKTGPQKTGVPAKSHGVPAKSPFEEDDDLTLPSYGRTPIPTDKDRHLVGTPVSPSPLLPSFPAPATKPRREQMVWDPDRREYVPLVISEKKPKPQAASPKKELPKKVAEPKKETSMRHEPPSAKERPPQPVVAKPTKKVEKKPLPVSKPAGNQSKSKPQNDRSQSEPREPRSPQRGGVQLLVESQFPNPADAEADSTGFAELGLSDTMLEALKVVRYLEPTPIQAGVFKLLQAGRDIMGQARTGTGKTAAFSIPILEGIEECPPGDNPVALILVPTRELAVQVRDEAMRLAYGRDIRITACYGGKPLAKQIARLRDGIDIIVGTPGRLLDLMNRRALSLEQLRWVVLDEADRMLDIGFRPDIEKILKRTPSTRQTLLFSATLPPPVVRLAERYMREPEVLDFSNKAVAVETIDQYYVTVDPERKFDALVYLLNEQQPNQAIIFTRTKRGADRLARLLSNQVKSLAAIHGDLAQTDRDRVMGQFRAGKLKYLVATDVVGRGIDVTGISHIINYDIPKFCDDYVHRVGRTGRMGREGVAFTFVTVQEGTELTRIEMRIDKLLKRAELKGFESFTKPTDPNATLDDDTEPALEQKPVYGKPIRKIRRAL